MCLIYQHAFIIFRDVTAVWRAIVAAPLVYEGVDYSNKANRVEAAGGPIPFQFIDTGKRERKKVASYKEDNFYRQQQAAAVKKRTVVSCLVMWFIWLW